MDAGPWPELLIASSAWPPASCAGAHRPCKSGVGHAHIVFPPAEEKARRQRADLASSYCGQRHALPLRLARQERVGVTAKLLYTYETDHAASKGGHTLRQPPSIQVTALEPI